MRPRMLFRALRPPMIFGASLPGMIFPAQRPAEGSNSCHYGSHATRRLNYVCNLSIHQVSIPLWFSRNLQSVHGRDEEGQVFPYHYGSFTFGGQSHFVRPVFASQRPVPTSSGIRTVLRKDQSPDPEQELFRKTSCVGSDQIGFLSHNELDRFLFFASDQPLTTNHPQRLLAYHYGSYATRFRIKLCGQLQGFHTTMVLTQLVAQAFKYDAGASKFPYHYGSYATRIWVIPKATI